MPVEEATARFPKEAGIARDQELKSGGMTA
jgi:hypothetical protein